MHYLIGERTESNYSSLHNFVKLPKFCVLSRAGMDELQRSFGVCQSPSIDILERSAPFPSRPFQRHTWDNSRSLDISIVGACIGGLAAAVALRRNGHIVQSCEATSREWLTPRWQRVPGRNYSAKIDSLANLPQGIFCHRSYLYDELKRLAVGDAGEGPPAKLFLGSKVLECDPEEGTITLHNGEVIRADLVLATDGIRALSPLSVTIF
ncbi:hypothetical protein DFH06DRAFT_1425720 [Mycena polygramma]|nr:hypothetical protein DFH06DRAFT_1425720 [Mycena polygramma]